MRKIQGKAVIAGEARGEALVSTAPLSFWGGYDAATGEIIDRRHPLSGCNASGRILALPSARGSSTGSQVLLEAIRAGTAPAALITAESDFFFALACVIADELYGRSLPLIAVSQADFAQFRSGDQIVIEANGVIEIGVLNG